MTPLKKNQNINTVYYNVLFPHIIFHSTGLYPNMDNRHDFVLGTFEYVEADREICRKYITKCIQYSTICHVLFTDYFTYSTIVCRSNIFLLALAAQPFAVIFAHKVVTLITDEFGFLVL